ncbi:hypothetical protein MKZ38_005582 [Zalerion maritima]|uniref:Uncharacterized protein n=1 Tax=Zalerion maritima TaxID=339359 RepID=A0AAD5RQQ6_9PEZI|nr:hypothetical protein MKZ38_005582 [Zalerion maritima]
MAPSAAYSTCSQLQLQTQHHYHPIGHHPHHIHDDENSLWAFGPTAGPHTNWLPSNPTPYSLASTPTSTFSRPQPSHLPSSSLSPGSSSPLSQPLPLPHVSRFLDRLIGNETKGPTSFPRFKDLPPELRSRIWSFAILSSFSSPSPYYYPTQLLTPDATPMTMTTLDARLDVDRPARILDSEFHLLLAPHLPVLLSCRDAYFESQRAISKARKVVGLRVLLGKGRLDYYYDRTYVWGRKLRWLKPLMGGARGGSGPAGRESKTIEAPGETTPVPGGEREGRMGNDGIGSRQGGATEIVCMDLPRLYQGDSVFQSKESFVQTLRNVAGDGIKRLCLGAAVFGDPLYTSYDGSGKGLGGWGVGSSLGEGHGDSHGHGCGREETEAGNSKQGVTGGEGDGRRRSRTRMGRYGSVTTEMIQKYFERGVVMFPRSHSRSQSTSRSHEDHQTDDNYLNDDDDLSEDTAQPEQPVVELLGDEEDKPLRLSAQKSGRDFVEIARIERSGKLKVAGDLPGRERWEDMLGRELTPILSVLKSSFPLLEGIHVMTESQNSVLRTFEALGWKYDFREGGNGGRVVDGM